MTISIVVPAYNIAPWLPRCLDSILAQTYPNLEILVVNDGSTDGTANIMDTYAAKDSRIKAIHKENGGVTSARLRGVAEATGEWIGFVDGDDSVEPQMFARLLENALQHEADISHCGYQMVFPDGHVDYYYNTGRVVEQDKLAGMKDLLEGHFIEPGLCNKLFRRELFVGLEEWMDFSIRINEDLLMNYYLFRQANRSIFENVCPYHYILRKGSAATAKWNEHKLRDPLTVTRILMEDAKGNAELEDVLYRKLTRQLIAGATMATDDPKDLIVPYRRETRQELRQRLKTILFGNTCDTKLKCMALWAAVWPAGYRWIHTLYAKVTGLDKKYSVE